MQPLRQFTAEVRFARARQATDHNKGRLNYRLRKLPQAIGQPLYIGSKPSLCHLLIIECFPRLD